MTSEARSRNMAAIKSKNTKPEIEVRKILHEMGYRFRLHRKDLPGNPDIVLPKYKTAIFVHEIENRQGLKIACLEEIALLNRWINKALIKKQINFYGNCNYSNYIKKLLNKSA